MPTAPQHRTGSAQHQGPLQWGQSTSAAAARPGREEAGRGGCLWLLSSWAAPGPGHAGIFLGLGSRSWRHGESLRKSSSRCTGTHLCCALLSEELPGGSISRNASLDYPLLLDSPDRRKKKAPSLLWNVRIREYLVLAQSQTSCGNAHKWQGKDNSLSVKFLYLHRKVQREGRKQQPKQQEKWSYSRRSVELCVHRPRAMAGWEHVLAQALLRHFTAYWGFPTMQKYSVNCFQSFCLPILNWNRGFGSKNVSYMKRLR